MQQLMESTLRIALQKKGRLSEGSLELLRECGIKFSSVTGSLRGQSSNFPIDFLFLRDDDIPGYVADGVADIGIVGENVLLEKQKEVELVKRLGFSRCRLSLAIPRNQEYQGLASLDGQDIATSYPRLVEEHFRRQGYTARIHEISGSVEIAPSIGLAQAICDLVSSGSTLLSNGLKEVETILKSEAVLVSTPGLPQAKQNLLQRLVFRIEAVQQAGNNKYILMNVPNEAIQRITETLPGMKSPTVMPLAAEGWSSIHTVINENEFWEQIDTLQQLGAQGILVVPIEKMIV